MVVRGDDCPAPCPVKGVGAVRAGQGRDGLHGEDPAVDPHPQPVLQVLLCSWLCSYTTFNVTVSVPGPMSYSDVTAQLASGVSPHLAEPLSVVTVTVTNTGGVASDFAALLFVMPPAPGVDGAPLQYLDGFDRIHLAPKQTQVREWMPRRALWDRTQDCDATCGQLSQSALSTRCPCGCVGWTACGVVPNRVVLPGVWWHVGAPRVSRGGVDAACR